jgi:hypothetical protein
VPVSVQADMGVGDADVAAGRYYEDHARLEGCVIRDGAHGQRTAAREDLLEVAGTLGVEMLRYYYGGW